VRVPGGRSRTATLPRLCRRIRRLPRNAIKLRPSISDNPGRVRADRGADRHGWRRPARMGVRLRRGLSQLGRARGSQRTAFLAPRPPVSQWPPARDLQRVGPNQDRPRIESDLEQRPAPPPRSRRGRHRNDLFIDPPSAFRRINPAQRTHSRRFGHRSGCRWQRAPRDVDNRGHAGKSKGIEFDPWSQQTVWGFYGTADNDFYTRTCGSNVRLANGNTLITESDSGRAFEVTPSGAAVWRFCNPARAGDDDAAGGHAFRGSALAGRLRCRLARRRTDRRDGCSSRAPPRRGVESSFRNPKKLATFGQPDP
jgi:hypothetical protein